MINACFFKSGGRFAGFEITGHSGYDEAGKDIVCAGVSMMSMLAVNTATEIFGAESETVNDESVPMLSFILKKLSQEACGVIQGFYNECLFLSQNYPDNIKVSVKNKSY